jgi:hypothetical protein
VQWLLSLTATPNVLSSFSGNTRISGRDSAGVMGKFHHRVFKGHQLTQVMVLGLKLYKLSISIIAKLLKLKDQKTTNKTWTNKTKNMFRIVGNSKDFWTCYCGNKKILELIFCKYLGMFWIILNIFTSID